MICRSNNCSHRLAWVCLEATQYADVQALLSSGAMYGGFLTLDQRRAIADMAQELERAKLIATLKDTIQEKDQLMSVRLTCVILGCIGLLKGYDCSRPESQAMTSLKHPDRNSMSHNAKAPNCWATSWSCCKTHSLSASAEPLHLRIIMCKDADASDCLQMLSHELRTPMNGVIGLSEALLCGNCGPLNEKTSAFVHTIHQSSCLLLNMWVSTDDLHMRSSFLLIAFGISQDISRRMAAWVIYAAELKHTCLPRHADIMLTPSFAPLKLQ